MKKFHVGENAEETNQEKNGTRSFQVKGKLLVFQQTVRSYVSERAAQDKVKAMGRSQMVKPCRPTLESLILISVENY